MMMTNKRSVGKQYDIFVDVLVRNAQMKERSVLSLNSHLMKVLILMFTIVGLRNLWLVRSVYPKVPFEKRPLMWSKNYYVGIAALKETLGKVVISVGGLSA